MYALLIEFFAQLCSLSGGIFHITDVEQDTLGCVFTERQRPEYAIKGGGHFSLRDRIEAQGNRSAERWLEAHSKFPLTPYSNRLTNVVGRVTMLKCFV